MVQNDFLYHLNNRLGGTNHYSFLQVRELVSPELYSRYDRLLLQSSLDTMADIMYCPRKACGCAVMVDWESGMGSCAACNYIFCVYCKRVYHGVSPCKISSGLSSYLTTIVTVVILLLKLS